MFKPLISKAFAALGLEIRRATTAYPYPLGETSMRGGLARAKHRKTRPATVIDVGAAQGKWSLEAMNAWPDAEYLLIEPLQERKAELSALAKRYSNIHVVHAIAGAADGEVDYTVTHDLDGSGVFAVGQNRTQVRKVLVTSIDVAVRKFGLKPPFLIKLDTHGYEVPILKGATETVKVSELLVIESYGFQVAPDSLVFWELCKYLDQRGFRLLDLVDISLRPLDLAFWQCDAFFAPNTHSTFNCNDYRDENV